MKTIETMYLLLGIKRKIENDGLRLLYLKEIWGLDQRTIADLEKSTQPSISRSLSQAKKKFNEQEVKNLQWLSFTADEIKYIQSLPREILTDSQCISFVNDILGLYVNHPFYSAFNQGDHVRICALAQLGIMNKKLEKIFGRTQAGVSMIIKRNSDRVAEIERPLRYDLQSSVFEVVHRQQKPQEMKPKFTLAGGQ